MTVLTVIIKAATKLKSFSYDINTKTFQSLNFKTRGLLSKT